MKKKEWVKMLGAFVLGALVMLALTGAGGALWQGKVTAPPFSLDEKVITVGCTTTNCEISTQLSDVSSSLAGAINMTNNHYIPTALTTLSDQLTATSGTLSNLLNQINAEKLPDLAEQLQTTSDTLVGLIRTLCD